METCYYGHQSVLTGCRSRYRRDIIYRPLSQTYDLDLNLVHGELRS